MYTGVEFLIRLLLLIGCDFRLKNGNVFLLLISSIFWIICWTPKTGLAVASQSSPEIKMDINYVTVIRHRKKIRKKNNKRTCYNIITGFLFGEITIIVVVVVIVFLGLYWYRYVARDVVIRRVAVPKLLVSLYVNINSINNSNNNNNDNSDVNLW